MDTYKFNRRGFLIKTQDITITDFENLLVKDKLYKRRIIFEEFTAFIEEFSKIMNLNKIFVWVNGSFVSDEIEPKDIDFVIFLNDVTEGFSDKVTEIIHNYNYMDVYFVLRNDDKEIYGYWRDYWKYSFSHHLTGFRKGFLKLSIEINEGKIV